MVYYKSNCLIEAVKTYVASKGKVKIHKIGKWKWIFTKRCFPHFYWKDEKGIKYKFEAKYSDEPLHGQLWYEGYIESYKKD